MTNIYRSAQTVLVWLGKEREDTDPDDELRRSWASPQDTFAFARRVASLNCSGESTAEHLFTPEFMGLFVLLQRPWFERLWVLQEFAVARNVEVICGTSYIPWYVLEKACKHLSESPIETAIPEQILRSQSMPRLLHFIFCQRIATEQSMNLESLADKLSELLFSVVGHQKVGDPRDRLYSILGMCHRSENRLQDPRILPNYRKTSAQIYKGLAKYLIEERKSLDILCGHHDILDGCPSWVPTWRKSTGSPMLGRFYKGHGLTVMDPDFQARFEFSDDDNILRVRGVDIGEIAAVGSQPKQESTNIEALPILRLRSLFLEWEEQIVGCPFSKNKFHTAEQALHAWKMVVMYDLLSTDVDLHIKAVNLVLYEAIVGRMKLENEEMETFTNQLAWDRHRKLDDLYPIITSSGDMGLTDSGFELQPLAGDFICLFLGGPVPFVVRKNGKNYRLLGPCYLSNFMEKETQQETFRLTVPKNFDLV